jgi:hypothetical protein
MNIRGASGLGEIDTARAWFVMGSNGENHLEARSAP